MSLSHIVSTSLGQDKTTTTHRHTGRWRQTKPKTTASSCFVAVTHLSIELRPLPACLSVELRRLPACLTRGNHPLQKGPGYVSFRYLTYDLFALHLDHLQALWFLGPLTERHETWNKTQKSYQLVEGSTGGSPSGLGGSGMNPQMLCPNP